MKYVHVAGKPCSSHVDYNPSIINQNGLCLYSLIEGLGQQNFNTHTLDGVLDSIEKYRECYVKPVAGKLFIDSGGYSIIRGAVHPTNVPRFIQCYNYVLENEVGLCDRIFSLDIPWSCEYGQMNTKEVIAKLNGYALQSARDILVANPEALAKFYFVWHFKMLEQYEIWSHLYERLELNKLIKNRAIGGMVALRGATGIQFSPFTAIAYRCLFDYLDAGFFDTPFTLHYLGMYLPYDRFQMALLEGLFRHYLADGSTVETTYDSINFSHTARMNQDLPLFMFEADRFVTLDSLTDAPSRVLSEVYRNTHLIEFVKSEIERRNNQEHLERADTFAPLNIYSNRQLDLFFELTVQEKGIVDLVIQEASLTRLKQAMKSILEDLTNSHPRVFTKHMCGAVLKNVEITYEFHRWFMSSRKRIQLEELVLRFIRSIRFPAKLM